MKYAQCKCLYCQKPLDRNTEEFVQVKKRFAHSDCKYVRDKIHDYCSCKYGNLYFLTTIDKQINELVSEGMTLLEIFKTLVWWYDIHGGDVEKSHGSIRIVKSVYGEAMDYYALQKNMKNKNLNVTKENMYNETEIYTIHPSPISKPKKIKLFEI